MLVNCAAYKQGRKLADIDQGQIGEYFGQPDTFVWVALKDPSEAELQEMQRTFQLHPLAIEDAAHAHQRPKIDEYGDQLFAVMTVIEVAPTDDYKLGEIHVFAGPGFVLSVRHRTQRGFSDVRTRCEREPHLLRHGSGYVLYALMDAVVDRYFPVLESLQMELELLEGTLFSGGSSAASARENIESLYYVKQQLTTLKHATAPLLEYTGKLFGGRVPLVCSGLGEYYRDVYDHLIRLNQSIDAARDTITTAIQVNVAMITYGETEVTKRLAAWAALIAVPTFIASLYGMNFKHMPELEWPLGYPLVLGAMAVLDLYFWYRFRKAGWL